MYGDTDPRIVNTGVTGKPEERHATPRVGIDWLQYSVRWPSDAAEWPSDGRTAIEWLSACLPPHDGLIITGEILRPMPGYNSGMGASFARLFYHTQNAKQHIGVIFTGSDLEAAISVALPHDELLCWVKANAHKISRLDFALDVFDPAADPRDISHMWATGELLTTARTVSTYTSMTRDGAGQVHHAPTIYVGAPSGERQLRIYDKAKERGVAGHWVRIELTVRDWRAMTLAGAMVDFGIAHAGRAAIRDFIVCKKLDWLNDALTGPVVYIEPGGRKLTDTERWLYEQVMPVMRRTMIDRASAGDWHMYDAVEQVLLAALRETGRIKLTPAHTDRAA